MIGYKKEMQIGVRKVTEVIPGYLMMLDWSEGKRHVRIVNMYYPTGEGADKVAVRKVIIARLSELVMEGARQGRGVLVMSDANAWAKRGEERNSLGLYDVARMVGRDEEHTFERLAQKTLETGEQGELQLTETRIDLCLCTESIRGLVGDLHLWRNDRVQWGEVTDHHMVVLDARNLIPDWGGTVSRKVPICPSLAEVEELRRKGDKHEYEQMQGKVERYKGQVREALAALGDGATFEAVAEMLVAVSGATFGYRTITMAARDFEPKDMTNELDLTV